MAAALAPMNCRHAVWSCEAEQAAATSATSHTLRRVTGGEGGRERERGERGLSIAAKYWCFLSGQNEYFSNSENEYYTMQQNEVCLGTKKRIFNQTNKARCCKTCIITQTVGGWMSVAHGM